MTVGSSVAGVLAVLVVAYLVYTMLRPEKF